LIYPIKRTYKKISYSTRYMNLPAIGGKDIFSQQRDIDRWKSFCYSSCSYNKKYLCWFRTLEDHFPGM